jgi:ubiquinone/menaquinone biosynthesis C-methylase UbiE
MRWARRNSDFSRPPVIDSTGLKMSTADAVERLASALDQHESITNAEWLASLDERKRKELEFHDRDRDRAALPKLDSDTFERFYGNKKYYDATARSKAYVADWIRSHARGKIFLDYACGNGEQAIFAAKNGARLSVGIDISEVSIRNARADAEAAGIRGNVRFVQADAENTRLPDECVDVILCSGMLHHLDLSYAFPELRRILAPGGKILAVEALDYNPLIKLYRKITPEMRTEWEAAYILDLNDVRFARRFFNVIDIKHWHMTSVLAPHLKAFPLSVFDSVDRVLERVPGVRLMSWMFTFVMEKEQSANGQSQDAPSHSRPV